MNFYGVESVDVLKYRDWLNVLILCDPRQGTQINPVLDGDGRFDLVLEYGGVSLINSFEFDRISNRGDVEKGSKLHFRYKSINVDSNFRNMGVCSYLILHSMIYVLGGLEKVG